MRSQLFEWARWIFQRIPPGLLRWRPFTVYEIEIEIATSSCVAPDEDLCLHWATAEDQERCSALSPAELFRGLGSESGYTALVAERAGQPIGIVWFSPSPFVETELGIGFDFGPNDVWLFAAHVHSQHRQSGVYTLLLSHAIREHLRNGKRRILLGTTHGNVASKRSHAKFAATPLGTVVAARIGSIVSWATCSGEIQRKSGLVALGRNARLELAVR